jgi:hypothetical protein
MADLHAVLPLTKRDMVPVSGLLPLTHVVRYLFYADFDRKGRRGEKTSVRGHTGPKKPGFSRASPLTFRIFTNQDTTDGDYVLFKRLFELLSKNNGTTNVFNSGIGNRLLAGVIKPTKTKGGSK